MVLDPHMKKDEIIATAAPEIRSVNVVQYIVPLREGGSLPAIVEADDGFRYVLKFRGAGHGTKALIAEFIGSEIARRVGLNVPEVVFANLDEHFGRAEADEEIQDLLRGSHGLNLGLHYLSGAVNFDPVVTTVDAYTASKVVWLDAFLTNIDRTFRNTNMLIWHKELWLIDHGASLYFHHTWDQWKTNAQSTFPYVKDHVLLPQADCLLEVHEELKQVVTPDFLYALIRLLPDEWLTWDERELAPEQIRFIYYTFLTDRLTHAQAFVQHAIDARNV